MFQAAEAERKKREEEKKAAEEEERKAAEEARKKGRLIAQDVSHIDKFQTFTFR